MGFSLGSLLNPISAIGGLFGGGGGDAPPAPDYRGAAEATAAGNQTAAQIAANASRLNQFTPYGNLTYSPVEGSAIDPTTGQPNANFQRYSATQTLTPAQQQQLDANQRLQFGLTGAAEQGLGAARGLFSNPTVDMNGLPNPIGGEGAQAAIMQRLQPQMDRQREQLRTQLLNQGIGMGNEAYSGAMTDQNQRENDLLTQAALQGINLDIGARGRGLQERAYQQDRPLNLINALRSGGQIQSPNFVNTPQQQMVAGPNYLGAADAQYGQQMNAYMKEHSITPGAHAGVAETAQVMALDQGGRLIRRVQ